MTPTGPTPTITPTPASGTGCDLIECDDPNLRVAINQPAGVTPFDPLAPQLRFQVWGDATHNAQIALMGNEPNLNMVAFQGSPLAPTASPSAGPLFGFTGFAFDGTVPILAGSLEFTADGAPASPYAPSSFLMRLNRTGVGPTQPMAVFSNGWTHLGGTNSSATAVAPLDVGYPTNSDPGYIALAEKLDGPPALQSGYGQVWTDADCLHFVDQAGTDYDLTCGAPSPTPVNTSTATPGNTATNTPTITSTPTVTPTAVFTYTGLPCDPCAATKTFTPTFTITPTFTPFIDTATPVNTATKTPTFTVTPTFTAIPPPPTPLSCGDPCAEAVDWTRLQTYPTACSAGSFVSTLADVPTCTSNASTASALAANPTDCGSNTYATTIDASGNLTCSAVSLTAGVTGVLSIANGGTNQSGTLTAGSVLFSSGTAVTQDNANLFWDDSNNSLGVGTAAVPTTPLDVAGVARSFTDAIAASRESVARIRRSLTSSPSATFAGNLSLDWTVDNSTAVTTFSTPSLGIQSLIPSGNGQTHTTTLGGMIANIEHGGSGTLSGIRGASASAFNIGSGTVTLMEGFQTAPRNTGTGTVTTSRGYTVSQPVGTASPNTAVWTSIFGIDVLDQKPSGTGTNTLTNPPVAVRIQDQTATSSIGVQQQGTTAHNRFQGKVNIGADAAPTSQLDVGTASQFQVSSAGIIPQYNGIATVSNGVPSELGQINTTGLTANVAAATLYAVPAGGAGLYRISAYVVLTTAASVSSTLPNVQIVYTDIDSNTSVTIDATPVLGVAGTGQTGALTANTVGTVSSGVIVVNAKLSTTIQYKTVNYASSLAGMAYAIHLRAEAM